MGDMLYFWFHFDSVELLENKPSSNPVIQTQKKKQIGNFFFEPTSEGGCPLPHTIL
jgi:hypothetical protein